MGGRVVEGIARRSAGFLALALLAPALPLASPAPAAAITAAAASRERTAEPARRGAREGPAECRVLSRTSDRLAGAGPPGELVLASGSRARLDGVRPAREGIAAARAAAFVEALRGREVVLGARGPADRWGRVPADILVLAPGPAEAPLDLAGALVAEGLAHVDPGERDALCRPALLALEDGARRAGRGVWARAGVLAADDLAALHRAAAEGRFVVAEGRVRSVGERRATTYLNFAGSAAQGLSVAVSKRAWRAMLDRGLSALALRGRRVRARGLLEVGRGPLLMLEAADALELLEGPPQAPSRAGTASPGGPSGGLPGAPAARGDGGPREEGPREEGPWGEEPGSEGPEGGGLGDDGRR